ncbi:hypothetical protein A1OE_104 [Candidatus Endolissoclinum faulkneri L2]|uniref:Uncharacterized protein n=1 Tax=Candidatus Endolissoclinum faulkneri L2 TaxID=1193729 RepID=K7YFF3_9PROT|nr:hypothetical protein A1OE_104 [Candidatus Endolissoclinum faulkneri L2]
MKSKYFYTLLALQSNLNLKINDLQRDLTILAKSINLYQNDLVYKYFIYDYFYRLIIMVIK